MADSMTATSLHSRFAASGFARSPYFRNWATGAGLIKVTPQPEVAHVFDQLTMFILPYSFARLNQNLAYTQHGESDFYKSLQEWILINADLVDQQQGRDDVNLGVDSKALFLAYWAILDAVKEKSCEYAQRRGVDTLVQLAFATRLRATHKVCFEQELRLRASLWQSIEVSATAIAGTIVTMPIPGKTMSQIALALNDKSLLAANQDIMLGLFWATRTKDSDLNSLILFPGEFKKAEHTRNQNQLLVDFATAQSQRFAFGLPDAIIWGATCTMGVFRVYSSSWSSNHSAILWSYHTEWNLTVPIEFLRCYSFLCSLSNNLKELGDSIQSLDPTAVAEKCSHPAWYARTSSSIQREQAPEKE